MPTLSDSLASVATQSTLITHLSSLNSPREGPYTRAYLSSAANIFTTIREAHDHERRLFGFIGEEAGGKGKVVEKRREAGGGEGEGGTGRADGSAKVVKEGKETGGIEQAAWNDAGLLLNTALKLVDEYNTMPRARAHIVSLLESQSALAEDIARLERMISDVSAGDGIAGLGSAGAAPLRGSASKFGSSSATRNSKTNQSESLFDEEPPEMNFLGDTSLDASPIKGGADHADRAGSTSTRHLDPEEWLKVEEEELKVLERRVAEKRRAQRPGLAKGHTESASSLPLPDITSPRSARKSSAPATSPSARIASGFSPTAQRTMTHSSRAPATPGMRELGRSQSGRTPRTASGRQVGEQEDGQAGSGARSSTTPLTNFFGNTPGRRTVSGSGASPIPRFGTAHEDDVHTPSSTAMPTPTQPSKPKSIFDRKRLQARQTLSLAQAQAQAAVRVAKVTGVDLNSSVIGAVSPAPMGEAAAESAQGGAPNEIAQGGQQLSASDRPAHHEDVAGTPILQGPESPTVDSSATNASADPTTPKAALAQNVARKRVSAGGSPTAAATTPRTPQRQVVHGVEIKNDLRPALTSVWNKLGDTLRSGEDPPASTDNLSAAATIDRIAFLAGSPLPPPLSPSSASTLSTALSSLPGAAGNASPKITPLTNVSILTCHLLLALLRSTDCTMLMADMKEVIGKVATGRGWDPALGTKVIYGALAKKVLTIDRRANGGIGGGMIVLERK